VIKKRVLNIFKANFEKICSICPKEKEDELMEASRVMHEASSGTVTAELDDEESIANYANHSIELGKSQTMPKVKFVVQLPGEVFLEKFLLASDVNIKDPTKLDIPLPLSYLTAVAAKILKASTNDEDLRKIMTIINYDQEQNNKNATKGIKINIKENSV